MTDNFTDSHRLALGMSPEAWAKALSELIDEGLAKAVRRQSGKLRGKTVFTIIPEHEAEALARVSEAAAIEHGATPEGLEAFNQHLAAEGYLRVAGRRKNGKPLYELVDEREEELEAVVAAEIFRGGGGKLS